MDKKTLIVVLVILFGAIVVIPVLVELQHQVYIFTKSLFK